MKHYIIAVATTLLTGFAHGQTPQQKLSIDSALSYFKDNYPQEKMLLQTDKERYAWDETIWMKTWCVLDGMPSYLSRIIYVDLRDESGKVILKKMYHSDSLASSPADFSLPDNVVSGNYTVNAYTLWMLNFPELIATKNIFIYGKTYNSEKSIIVKPKINLAFFPEGGDIINGIENNIAFKMTDQYGYAVKLKAYISDKSGKKLAEFEPEHEGMGVLKLTPVKNENYTATITGANGVLSTFPLPAAKDEGINLQVNNTNPNRVGLLVGIGEVNKVQFSKLKIVAQINNRIVFAQPLNTAEGEIAAAINKKNLPAGILQITIFTENDLPVCERLVFVDNYTIIQPQIKTGQIKTTARALNKLTIPAFANKSSLAVMISDVAAAGDSLSGNVISGLLLTSDVKGYVSNPGYYVKDKSALTLHHLDLLLMTQGWRRFHWKKILQNDFPVLKYPVESAMSISGKVTKSDRSTAVTNGFVSFIIKTSDSATILADAKLTDKGEFLLDDLNFVKKAAIHYMGTDDKKNKFIVDVKLNPNYFDSLQRSTYTFQVDGDTLNLMNSKNLLATYFSDKLKLALQENANYLANVTVKGRKLAPVDSLNAIYAAGPFAMGKGINPADYKNYRTIWQMIQASVPGITVTGDFFNPTVTFNRNQGLNGFSDNVSATDEEYPGLVTESNGIAYFLNEMNVSKDIINTLTVNDVAYIKVLKNEASVLGASEGAIVIYTKTGAVAGEKPYDKNYTRMEKEGYAIVKEFFSPDYQLNPDFNKEVKDVRQLLYWNAKPVPAKDGLYHFTFFNSDVAKKYLITIQGIDAKGGLIYIRQILE